MKQKTKVVVFSRVSTQIQDTLRQTEELKEYAERMNYQVLQIFEEKISGTKKTSERPVLQSMLTYIENNPVQKILIWELSRIGRNSLEVLQILNQCNAMKVSIFIKNFNIETLDDKGHINPMTQFMLEIINTLNQLERNNIVQRLRSGFEQYRKTNPIGRKVGSFQTEEELLGKYPQVLKYLKKGLSIRQVSGLTNNTSTNTILKVKKTAIKKGILTIYSVTHVWMKVPWLRVYFKHPGNMFDFAHVLIYSKTLLDYLKLSLLQIPVIWTSNRTYYLGPLFPAGGGAGSPRIRNCLKEYFTFKTHFNDLMEIKICQKF